MFDFGWAGHGVAAGVALRWFCRKRKARPPLGGSGWLAVSAGVRRYCCGGSSGVGWGGGSSKGNPFVSASAFRFTRFMVSSIPSARPSVRPLAVPLAVPLASALVSMGRTSSPKFLKR